MAEQKPFQIKRKKDQTFPTNHPYNIWRLYTFYIYKAVLITSRQYRTFCVSWNISTCLNMIKYSMCQNNFKTRFTQFLLNWYSFHIIHVMSETTKSDRNRGSRLFEKVCERNILQERMLCNDTWHWKHTCGHTNTSSFIWIHIQRWRTRLRYLILSLAH